MRTAEEILKKCDTQIGDYAPFKHEDIITAMKEFAEQAFNAGRERLNHPDWDFIYDDFQEYFNSLK